MTPTLRGKIAGLSCSACAAAAKKVICALPGVEDVLISGVSGDAVVHGEVEKEAIARAVAKAGYSWHDPVASPSAPHDHPQIKNPHFQMAVAWVGALLGFVAFRHSVPFGDLGVMGTLLIVLGVAGRDLLAEFWTTLRTRNFNMETLIGIGITGAVGHHAVAVISTIKGTPLDGMGREGLLLFAIYISGQYLEELLKGRADRAVKGLLELSPPLAVVRSSSGEERETPLEEIGVGDIVVVLPGGTIPLDGEVIDGEGEVDESLVTGESLPVRRIVGDKVIGGTQNGSGCLIIRVESSGADGYLSQLARMVGEASATRVPIQGLADRIVAVFVPIVLAFAAGAALLWALAPESMATIRSTLADPLGLSPDPMAWWLVSLAVLVVSCPCPLGIATPLALFVGAGRGARAGVIIREGRGIQALKDCKTLIIDKTGTLTLGRPQVGAVLPADGIDKKSVLTMAMAVEAGSEHPLARAILRHGAKEGLKVPTAKAFQAIAGEGMEAMLDGVQLRVGRPKWLGKEAESLADSLPPQQSAVGIQKGGQLLGVMGLEDILREEAEETVGTLQEMGLEVIVASGDRPEVVRRAAEAAGISEWHGAMRPEEKVALVKKLEREGRLSVFAGDGLNDAPALAASHVGVAMGTGTDLAKEAGDLILAQGDLRALVRAVNLSRVTFRIVGQNLAWAGAYNLIAIPLAFIGILHPAVAQAAMAASDIIVIANSLRLQKAKI